MLQPKRVRYRRPQDGRGNKGNAHRGTTLAFGSFGIKTLDAKWIDSRQIEAARVAINRSGMDSHLPGQTHHSQAC